MTGKDIKKLICNPCAERSELSPRTDRLSGDIFSNIVICAPQPTLDRAWEAAEMAGTPMISGLAHGNEHSDR